MAEVKGKSVGDARDFSSDNGKCAGRGRYRCPTPSYPAWVVDAGDWPGLTGTVHHSGTKSGTLPAPKEYQAQ